MILYSLHNVIIIIPCTFILSIQGIIPPVSAAATSQMYQTGPAAYIPGAGGSQPQLHVVGGAQIHQSNPG